MPPLLHRYATTHLSASLQFHELALRLRTVGTALRLPPPARLPPPTLDYGAVCRRSNDYARDTDRSGLRVDISRQRKRTRKKDDDARDTDRSGFLVRVRSWFRVEGLGFGF